MSPRKLGMRRTMTPNQIVAHNVARARALRGWTQEQAAEALAPYLGAKLSGASFSALERSAWKVEPDQTVLRRRTLGAVPRLRPAHRVLLHPAPARPPMPASTHPTPAGKDSTPSSCSTPSSAHPKTASTGNRTCSTTRPAPRPLRRANARSPASPRPTWPTGSDRSATRDRKLCFAKRSATSPTPATSLERLAEAIRLLDEPASDDSTDQTALAGTKTKTTRVRKAPRTR